MPSSFSPPRLGAIVLAGSLLLASSAAAQKLVEIGQTSVGTPVFLEAKSVTRRDGIVTAAVRVRLQPPLKHALGDLRAAAEVIKGRKVASGVRMLVVPGSARVRQQAQAEGLNTIFLDAGAEWREAGCSMCLAMNDDIAMDGERVASSTNRNFEGRQGRGARTHLMSPAMVAAAAISGHLADVRDFK